MSGGFPLESPRDGGDFGLIGSMDGGGRDPHGKPAGGAISGCDLLCRAFLLVCLLGVKDLALCMYGGFPMESPRGGGDFGLLDPRDGGGRTPHGGLAGGAISSCDPLS